MEPIRVLHILHSMNRGGTENAIMNYYREIERDKVQFDFLLTDSSKSDFEDEIIKLGGKIYRVSLLSLNNPFKYILEVNRFFTNHPEYIIVHSHTSSKSVIPLAIAKYHNIPCRIAHSHNSQSDKGLIEMIRDFLKPFLKVTANYFFSCSIIASEWLYGSNFTKRRKVSIIKNVIAASRFRYNPDMRKRIRHELGLSDRDFVIGHIARFHHQKNHLFSIEILKEALLYNPNTVLLLVGDGPEKNSIISYAKELGVSEKIKMTGVVPNVFDYTNAMDAFILPSLYEGFGLVIVEAQINGLPCFITKDKIPNECNVTNLVTYLPLEAGAKVWAEEILKSKDIARRDRFDEVKVAGYDAATEASSLQNLYLEMAKSIK